MPSQFAGAFALLATVAFVVTSCDRDSVPTSTPATTTPSTTAAAQPPNVVSTPDGKTGALVGDRAITYEITGSVRKPMKVSYRDGSEFVDLVVPSLPWTTTVASVSGWASLIVPPTVNVTVTISQGGEVLATCQNKITCRAAQRTE